MRLALFTLVLVAGCIERGTPLRAADTSAPKDSASAADSGTPGPSAADATADTAPSPSEPVFDDLPSEWLEAPPGFCENLTNQTIATYNHDGDTIGIVTGNKVRFIGINASEVDTSDCWSAQGTAALRTLLEPNKTICLQPDAASGDKDMYGRLLRYVYISYDGKWRMLNARMVRLGFAKAYHDFLKGTQYRTVMEQAELHARDESLGGWGSCGWVID